MSSRIHLAFWNKLQLKIMKSKSICRFRKKLKRKNLSEFLHNHWGLIMISIEQRAAKLSRTNKMKVDFKNIIWDIKSPWKRILLKISTQTALILVHSVKTLFFARIPCLLKITLMFLWGRLDKDLYYRITVTSRMEE